MIFFNDETSKKEIPENIKKEITKKSDFENIDKALDNIIINNDDLFQNNSSNIRDNSNELFSNFNIYANFNNFYNNNNFFSDEVNNLKRLNAKKLFYEDSFVKEFKFQLSSIEKIKKERYQNYTAKIPFYDSISDVNFTPNETLFYIMFNLNNKKSFLNKKDIEKIKKNDKPYNFGKDPCDVFYDISKSEDEENNVKITEFANNISKFYKFVSKLPSGIPSVNQLFTKNKISNKNDRLLFNSINNYELDKKNLLKNENKDSEEDLNEESDVTDDGKLGINNDLDIGSSKKMADDDLIEKNKGIENINQKLQKKKYKIENRYLSTKIKRRQSQTEKDIGVGKNKRLNYLHNNNVI